MLVPSVYILTLIALGLNDADVIALALRCAMFCGVVLRCAVLCRLRGAVQFIDLLGAN